MSRMKDHAIDQLNATLDERAAQRIATKWNPGTTQMLRRAADGASDRASAAMLPPTTAYMTLSIADLQALLDRAKEGSLVTHDGKVLTLSTITVYAPIHYGFRSGEKVQVSMHEATFGDGSLLAEAAIAYL